MISPTNNKTSSLTLTSNNLQNPTSKRFPKIHQYRLFEVFVFQDLFGSEPSVRVELQHHINQVNGIWVSMRADLSQILDLEFWERPFEVWQILAAWPDDLIGGSSQAENLENLIDFRVAAEQWEPFYHLSKDAGRTPDINRSRVHLLTKQDLWGSVPQSDNLFVLENQKLTAWVYSLIGRV